MSDQFCMDIKQPKNCSATACAIAFFVMYTWSIIAVECNRFVLEMKDVICTNNPLNTDIAW